MNIQQQALKQSILAAARQATKAEARRRVAVRLADQAADRAAKAKKEASDAAVQLQIRDSRARSAMAEVDAATARLNSLIAAMDGSGVDRDQLYNDPDMEPQFWPCRRRFTLTPEPDRCGSGRNRPAGFGAVNPLLLTRRL